MCNCLLISTEMGQDCQCTVATCVRACVRACVHRRACKQYMFLVLEHIYTFSAMRFGESPFTCQCEKGGKNAEGFQTSHFYWSFSSDIMAVKGLNQSFF